MWACYSRYGQDESNFVKLGANIKGSAWGGGVSELTALLNVARISASSDGGNGTRLVRASPVAVLFCQKRQAVSQELIRVASFSMCWWPASIWWGR